MLFTSLDHSTRVVPRPTGRQRNQVTNSDDIRDDVVERAVLIAEVQAMNIGISPLTDVEKMLIQAGAINALTVLVEMSSEERT